MSSLGRDFSEEELNTERVLELLASSRLKKPVDVVLWNGVVAESEVMLPRLTLLPLLWGWGTLGFVLPGVSRS